jgi:hypothetical protein
MPDTNKNRKAVVAAAIELTEMWDRGIWHGEELIQKEQTLRKAVREVQRRDDG